ncbi:MAG: DDE superfamily endonuclease, partial [Candidatus Kentron sp. G]
MPPPLPEAIVTFLSTFAPLFSVPVWNHAQVLLTGSILCQGPRTVAAILRVMGLADKKTFCNYHRVLSRDKWSGLQAAKILLGLLVAVAWAAGIPLIIVVDETIERRKGRKIKAKGKYRDAVCSTQDEVVKCWGLKWICFTVLIPVPWSTRYWALPFLTILATSEWANKAQGKRHKTTVDWTIQALKVISRWWPKNTPWTLVGDGAYAALGVTARVISGVASHIQVEETEALHVSRIALMVRGYLRSECVKE